MSIRQVGQIVRRISHPALTLSSYMERPLKLFMPRFPISMNINDYICDLIDKVFEIFVPDIDGRDKSLKSEEEPSIKRQDSLSILAISEIENYYRQNSELLKNSQYLITQKTAEMLVGHSFVFFLMVSLNIFRDPASTKEFLYNVLQHCRELEKFLYYFRTTIIGNLTKDIVDNMDFLNKNVRKLQRIIRNCDRELVNDILVFQFNFVLDQIQSGLGSSISNLRDNIKDSKKVFSKVVIIVFKCSNSWLLQ